MDPRRPGESLPSPDRPARVAPRFIHSRKTLAESAEATWQAALSRNPPMAEPPGGGRGALRPAGRATIMPQRNIARGPP